MILVGNGFKIKALFDIFWSLRFSSLYVYFSEALTACKKLIRFLVDCKRNIELVYIIDYFVQIFQVSSNHIHQFLAPNEFIRIHVSLDQHSDVDHVGF